MNLQQQLLEFSDLDCAVAKRFQGRPMLGDIASSMLSEQWQQRRIGLSHDPLTLHLISRRPGGSGAWIRPLAFALIERFCGRATLNLTQGEDFISSHAVDNPTWAVDIDLHAVELLINECGPLLLERYREELVEFWGNFDSGGQTPWQWYADHLQKQFEKTVACNIQDNRLSALEAANVNQLLSKTARPAPTMVGTSVALLSTDFSSISKIDVDLGSALLIERTSTTGSSTLLYTLVGKLLVFPSRPTMLAIFNRLWPANDTTAPHKVHIVPLAEAPFEAQALELLQQQLRVADVVSRKYHGEAYALPLSQDLDRLTSLVDLCDRKERAQRLTLSQHLPAWLRDAKVDDQVHYAQMLVDVAQAYHDADGEFWLDGVDTAQAFANRQLAQRFATDHPGSALLPEDVRIINHQVTAAAAAGQDALFASGDTQIVEFSFAELAIGNLGLLKPGRVELASKTTAPLPEWMNENYLRTLVTELDIASAYPRMLRGKLLDDVEQQRTRQKLLGDQLRKQLPALAMEQHLRGMGISEVCVKGVAQIFNATVSDGENHWVMRPLGLLKQVDASADHPLNAWIIELATPDASPCLLYRPLHQQPLLQYDDRLALFVALSTPGALQDDILQRLPEADRKVYAHGGFLEPHVFYPLDDTFAVPFGTPPPATLSLEAAVDDIGNAIYLASVQESIQRFQAHASTSAETRWNSWKELGWLLFNTLLPLAGSTLGKVGWLVQMEVALVQAVESVSNRDPEGHRIAMVNLLLNVALLLLSHTSWQLKLEEGQEGPLAREVPDTTSAILIKPAHIVTAPSADAADFNWASPAPTLDAQRRSELEALHADVSVQSLGAPIPSGHLAGLYLAQDECWVHLQGKVYKVVLDESGGEPRIVSNTAEPQLGPWLMRDEAGRWQLDVRLRLRGGTRSGSRIERLREANRQALVDLDQQLDSDLAQGLAQLKLMRADAAKFADSTSDAVLRGHLKSCQDASLFWEAHLERLNTRNALSPRNGFKVERANALTQRALSEQMVNLTLKRLCTPRRKQLAQFLSSYKGSMTPSDLAIYSRRLAELSPLIDQMVVNADAMSEIHMALKKLTNRGQDSIQKMFETLKQTWTSPDAPFTCRYLRLENHFNQLFTRHPIDNSNPTGSAFWLSLANDNVGRAISQHRQLAALDQPNAELATRLLKGIDEWLNDAKRQLANFKERSQDDDAPTLLEQIEKDVAYIKEKVRVELAEYPDYPPSITVAQLRKHVPGLIETEDHGLMLGVPREGDDTIVDVAGADPDSPPVAYRRENEASIEIAPTNVPTRPSKTGLKSLLKDSGKLMTRARTELELLQRAQSSSYQPVEIYDLLMSQKKRLMEQSNAIEQHLTDDNQTDEAAADQDAARITKALNDLSLTLESQADELRTQAALRQPPRMGEVQYLIDNDKVTAHRLGVRKLLAKVKGRAADYLDEYVIRYQQQPLWYAHFHYAALDTDKSQFLAGHLKTAAQRQQAGSTTIDPTTGKPIAIHRGSISSAAAAKYFFSL
ncbi:DUF6543 domain-containing protein [Pseudomonas entomophila]|uniref:DUF6543 domain-containing protein n=1 Tax=Pseudomonas entomophila TaxID=312306 RepID=UPI00200D068D|nr:DUF6543 domain-containing protein [Pseudomonas entomophila]